MKMTAPFLLLLLCLGMNCQRQTSSLSPNGKTTQDIYEKTVKLQAELKPVLNQLEQEKNSISIQGRELSEAEIKRINQIDAIQLRYAWFEENCDSQQSLKDQRACLDTLNWIQRKIKIMD
jgi:predicted S18 family serine protease